MMRTLVACIAACACCVGAYADLNEILDQYPAENHEDLARANAALASDVEGHVPALCAMLTPTGDHSDLSARYALGALTLYLAKDGAPDNYVHALGKVLHTSTQAAEIRALFVRELSLCGNDVALPYLTPLLGDPDLGQPALQALESIGGQPSGDAIARALPKLSGRQEAAAIAALGNMNYADATFAIADRLESEVADTREVALFALAHSGSESAYAPLMAAALQIEGADRQIALEYLLTYAKRIAAQGRVLNASKICRIVADHSAGHLAAAANATYESIMNNKRE